MNPTALPVPWLSPIAASAFRRLRGSVSSLLAALWLIVLPESPGAEPRLVPRKIIGIADGWKAGQVNEPILLRNPKNPGRWNLFYSAMQLGGSEGAIGKAWAEASTPLEWHEAPDNPAFRRDPRIPFEFSSIRLDSVVYRADRDEYWIYYTGSSDRQTFDAIGLAICPSGGDGYEGFSAASTRRHPSNPILSPGGQGRNDETHVSQGAVFFENGLWHSLYSYRTKNAVLPGIRHATSPDGVTWTKQAGPDLLTAAPEQRYIEWHQVCKVGDRYLMVFEGYNGGTRWGANVAVSTNLTSGWRKLPTTVFDQTQWANYSDAELFHVATPALYHLAGRWHLYFQAASKGFYSHQHWALWGADCDDLVRNRILAAE